MNPPTEPEVLSVASMASFLGEQFLYIMDLPVQFAFRCPLCEEHDKYGTISMWAVSPMTIWIAASCALRVASAALFAFGLTRWLSPYLFPAPVIGSPQGAVVWCCKIRCWASAPRWPCPAAWCRRCGSWGSGC